MEFESGIANQSDYNTTVNLNVGDNVPDDNSPDYIMKMLALRVFFYCVYLLIFIVGIFGNVLVCYVVFRNKSMMTVTNLFITNLALSDILLCVFAVPFTPLYLLTFRVWVFSGILCHLVPFAQGVSVYISAFTLMSIAIDRFFVIIYPFKPRMKIRVCLTIIISVWVASSLLTLPYGIFMDIVIYHDGNPYCEEIWPYEESRRAFGFSTTVLQFIIPFIIISFCYISVCGKLSHRVKSMPGAKSARKEEQERERTQKTNRMLISMVIIFGVSWLPLNCHNLILDFYIAAAHWKFSRAFFLLAHAVAMSSTCYNPFLYAWLNENFRKEFKQVLPCFRVNSVQGSARRKLDISKDNSKGKERFEMKQCNGSEYESDKHNNLIAIPDTNYMAIDRDKSTSKSPIDTTTYTTDLNMTSHIGTNDDVISSQMDQDDHDECHLIDMTSPVNSHLNDHLVIKYDQVHHEVEIVNKSKAKNQEFL